MPERTKGYETAVITVWRHNHNGDTRPDGNFAAAFLGVRLDTLRTDTRTDFRGGATNAPTPA